MYSKNVDKFIKMIDEIKSDGSDKVHFVLDFDWTVSKFIANGKRTQLSYGNLNNKNDLFLNARKH